MNNMDFFKVVNIYIEATLKSSLCSTQDLGATCIMHVKEERLQITSFGQIGKINYMTRCQQAIMTWHRLFYNPTMVVIINRQVLHFQADGYQLNI